MKWYLPSGSQQLYLWLLISFVLGVAIFAGVAMLPTRARKAAIGIPTFISGAFYVLLLIWPRHAGPREPFAIPNNGIERVSFFLEDATPFFKDLGTVLPAFLLGLGVYSLLRVHLGRLFKMQKDWAYSLVLLVSMVAMAVVGYWDWRQQKFMPEFKKVDFGNPEQWKFPQYAMDFLFNGVLQQMDAAMFSIIAFFILSAAYRAFRIRSVEATIMLAVALIMMLNMMGALQYLSSTLIDDGLLKGKDPNSPFVLLVSNLKLSEIAAWIKDTLQVPSLRAMEFGIAIGALAMGIRLWLGLEKSGVA